MLSMLHVRSKSLSIYICPCCQCPFEVNVEVGPRYFVEVSICKQSIHLRFMKDVIKARCQFM